MKLVNINILAYYCFIVYTVILEPTFSILKHLKVTQTCIFGTQKCFTPKELTDYVKVGKILTLKFKSHRDMTLFMIPKLPSFRGQRTWAQEGGGRGTENSILETDTI